MLGPEAIPSRTEPEVELKGNSHFQHRTQDSGQHCRHRKEAPPCGTHQTTEMRRGLKTGGKGTTSHGARVFPAPQAKPGHEPSTMADPPSPPPASS